MAQLLGRYGGILYPGNDTLMSDGNLVPVNDAERADHQSNNQAGDPHLRKCRTTWPRIQDQCCRW